MQEQQQSNFYDKLLKHLNKTFLTNRRIQELWLDLSNNTHQLRFKSIKNIYSTLTQGKADQIIYHKDKPIIKNSHIHDPQYSKRMGWRMVEKLITKIAFYLSEERGLKEIAPSILKAVGYTRKVNNNLGNKSSFIQYFSDVLDLLISENNLMAKKIYKILIDRGYISSVDEFYKLSRFEGSSDFIYGYDDDDSEGENGQDLTIRISKRQQSRKVINSSPSKKALMGVGNRRAGHKSSFFNNINRQQIQKMKAQFEDISQDDDDTVSQSSLSSEQATERANKINQNIYSEMEQVISNLSNDPQFQIFLASVSQEQLTTHRSKDNSSSSRREAVNVKQIIKSLRLKSFKANEKILEMGEHNPQNRSSQRKNSNQKLIDSNKLKPSRKPKLIKNRASIATALSKRAKQNIFKEQGIDGMQNLVISNLSKMAKLGTQCQEIQPGASGFKRSGERQKTVNFQQPVSEVQKHKLHRQSSNLDYLSSIFVFKKDKQAQRRRQEVDLDSPFQSTAKELETIFSHKKTFNLRRSLDSAGDSNDQNLFSNQKLSQVSKFYDPNYKKVKKVRFAQDNFNPAIIQFTAKRYHKHSSEGNDYLGNIKNKINVDQILQEDKETVDARRKTLDFGDKNRLVKRRREPMYIHHRKYEIYNRRTGRLLQQG